MKLPTAIRSAALVLGLVTAGAAWAGGGHHGRDVGGGGEHGHLPGPSPVAAPQGGGHWQAAPGHGTFVADGGRDHDGDHGHWGGHGHGGGDRWGGDHHWHHDWGHGDIRYFPHYDWDAWRDGYWDHGWYGPRFGWWWVVSGVWFFYPGPVYPYPDPYVPSDFVAPPPAPAAGQFWYFCPASDAYYPYVPTCPTGWQQVPAVPQPQPPNPPPPGG